MHGSKRAVGSVGASIPFGRRAVPVRIGVMPAAAAMTSRATRRLALASVMALLALASSGAPPATAATGNADVRLVRLLADVPDSMAGADSLHDIRVRVVPGNVLVFRKEGEFAALLPIDRTGGKPDSLRYFFYVEHPPFLWVIPGSRDKGIRTVGDGGTFTFDSFRLLWKGDGALGWVYFPDGPENLHLRFSVVSGQSVDQADPKKTEYWVELDRAEQGGF
jgi:hypothetical protein